jgi:hypothetical protein
LKAEPNAPERKKRLFYPRQLTHGPFGAWA